MSRIPSEDDPNPANVGKSGSPRSDEDDETLAEQIRDAAADAFQKIEETAPPSVASRLRTFRERLRRNRGLDTVWRVMVFALGWTLIAAGMVMWVIPGPGWATIILGLVVLTSEFSWANRALSPVRQAAQRATDAAMDPRRRKRNLTLAAIAGVLMGIALGWYLLTYGFTVSPIIEWSQALLDWFMGLFN